MMKNSNYKKTPSLLQSCVVWQDIQKVSGKSGWTSNCDKTQIVRKLKASYNIAMFDIKFCSSLTGHNNNWDMSSIRLNVLSKNNMEVQNPRIVCAGLLLRGYFFHTALRLCQSCSDLYQFIWKFIVAAVCLDVPLSANLYV